MHENAFLFRADNSDPHGMGQGVAHIPRRAGGERFVIPSFPAGVCLALPIVCVLDAGSCVLFMVSPESATELRQL